MKRIFEGSFNTRQIGAGPYGAQGDGGKDERR
jgi:hypothetical protein